MVSPCWTFVVVKTMIISLPFAETLDLVRGKCRRFRDWGSLSTRLGVAHLLLWGFCKYANTKQKHKNKTKSHTNTLSAAHNSDMYNSRTLIQLELRPGHKVEGTTCLSFRETGGLGYRSRLYSTYLGITPLQSCESDKSKTLSLSPIQVLTRQYRLNKTTCIKATPLRGDSFLAETCHINIHAIHVENHATLIYMRFM